MVVGVVSVAVSVVVLVVNIMGCLLDTNFFYLFYKIPKIDA